MKNIKIGFSTILTLLLFSGVTFAQQSDNADATASADVLAPVEVDKNTDLVFGNVSPGNTKTIDVESAILNGRAGGTTESAAQFTITKGSNSEVSLEWSLPSTLEDESSNTLNINFNDDNETKLSRLTTSSASDGDNQVDLTPADGVTLTASEYSSYFSASEFYVWLGGTVVPSDEQTQGSYSGTVTLTATYN